MTDGAADPLADEDDGPGFRWGIRERALLAEVRLWQRLGLPDPPPLLGRLADTLESAAAAVGAERARAEVAEAAIAAARAVPEDAPVYYTAEGAYGWAAGRNAVLDALAAALETETPE